MQGGSGEIKVACIVVIALVAAAAAPHAEAAIPCAQVLSRVSSCLGYLQRGGAVSPPCCDGVKSITNTAVTSPDLQALCGCIKSLAPAIGAKAEFINSLSVKCGINFPYKYSPSMDCSKLK